MHTADYPTFSGKVINSLSASVLRACSPEHLRVPQTCYCLKLPCVTHTLSLQEVIKLRTTPETFWQAEVSLVNGINQTTSLHQLRAARHHNTQRRQHQRQRRRHNTVQHDLTTQRHITQYAPHKTTTTNTTTANNREQATTTNQPQPTNNNQTKATATATATATASVMEVTCHPLLLDNE